MSELLSQILFAWISGVSLSYLTFIWFQTTFIVDYAILFRLGKLVKAKEWEAYVQINSDPKYPYFLRESYKCWFTKLIGCPFCIIGFLSLFLSFLVAWWSSFVIAFVAAVGFLLLMLLYKNVYS